MNVGIANNKWYNLFMNTHKWPLVANNQISEYLKKSLINNRVGGTYIFCGPDNLGKTTVARYFAQIVLCAKAKVQENDLYPCDTCSSCKKFIFDNNISKSSGQKNMSDVHGDFHILKKEKDRKDISVEQVRDFIRILSLSSFNGRYKVGIIKHADKLNQSGANALLKTLEEPKKDTIIILIVQDVESLPATIVSRSQILHFRPVKAEIIYEYLVDVYGVQREKARDLSRLCQGRPALAVKFLENKDFYDFYNNKVEALLDIFSADINGRFAIIDALFDKKIKGQEAVVLASRILEIWQGVTRDCLLLILGHKHIVQHIYLQDKIKRTRREHTVMEIVKMSKTLSSAYGFLGANVAPRLVFENIALNI